MGRHSAEAPAGSHEAGTAGEGEPGILEGARVLITRSPDRSEALVAALRQTGAEPLLFPLIDFERARDQHSLDVAFDALGAGAYSWLVVSSITTVRALKDKAAERGLTLDQCVPPSTRVATIGQSSRRVLESEGLTVHLVPNGVQSAAGLLAVWPGGRGSVLLPQADIATPLLGEGIRSRGANVQTVIAYCTVDYPANPSRRLSTGPSAAAKDSGGRQAAAVLDPAEAKAEIDAGRLHAVLAASPSAVRRIQAALSPLAGCRLVVIGRSTAEEAGSLGLEVASVASEPTPGGLVAAVIEALLPGHPAVTPSGGNRATHNHPPAQYPSEQKGTM
ncbi:uroporphyrinogen-III synthase [Micrococcaceae bacterium Sec5.7]